MAVVKTVKTIFQFRRATTAEWELNKNIVPAAGEPCFDLDLNTLRIGNGVDTYENLNPIGGVKVEVATDGKSIVLEDSVLKLAGFDAATVGAQPRKSADGGIEWVVPSNETVDGLQNAIAGLQSDVTNLQTNVTEITQIVMPSDEGAGTLLDRVESLEAKFGVGEDTIDAKIDAKINEFATRVTADGTINTIQELITYVSEHGGEVEGIINDISSLKELVGDKSVDVQIAEAVVDKVTVEEGKSLIADTLIAKLEAIDEDALANKIETIKLGETVLDITDKTVTIPVGAGLKFSEEITVAEDGTVGIGTISFSKITQEETEVIVMDGGSAV